MESRVDGGTADGSGFTCIWRMICFAGPPEKVSTGTMPSDSSGSSAAGEGTVRKRTGTGTVCSCGSAGAVDSCSSEDETSNASGGYS